MKHKLGEKKYLRYGDDFVIFTNDLETLFEVSECVKKFLQEQLSLVIHGRNDVIFPCIEGLKFLGCMLHPTHRCLQKRVWKRVLTHTDIRNISSYSGLVRAHCNAEMVKYFDWNTLDLQEE